MLSATRKSDGKLVCAFSESKENAPFACPECQEEVILRVGKTRISHFAHANLISCFYGEVESEEHRHCKMEIYNALLREPDVTNVALERPLGSVRPDISAYIRGVPVAIEVQISSLPIETIIRRTMDYAQKGIYVLWLLQWTPELDTKRYAPRFWEKWVHAAYFGRVYYWVKKLKVVSYHFDPTFRRIPKMSLYLKDGKKVTAGGYTRRSKRFRTGIRGKSYNLAADFVPQKRAAWGKDGDPHHVPAARLFMESTKESKFRRDPRKEFHTGS